MLNSEILEEIEYQTSNLQAIENLLHCMGTHNDEQITTTAIKLLTIKKMHVSVSTEALREFLVSEYARIERELLNNCERIAGEK